VTKAKSGPFDNGMICESCNDPKTSGCPQTKYRLFLGGGLGWGDMWMCDACLEKAEQRDRSKFIVAPYHELDSWYGMPSSGPNESHHYSWHGWYNYFDPRHLEEQYFHCRDKPAIVWYPRTIHHLDKAPEIVGDVIMEEYFLYNISMKKEAFNDPYIVKELTNTYEPKLKEYVESGFLRENRIPRKPLVTPPILTGKLVPIDDVDNTLSKIVDDKLKELAHKLWVERGCPIGSPEIDWAEAKRRMGIT
jgi:hypothetical protein